MKVVLLIILLFDDNPTVVERQAMLDWTMCLEEKRNVQDQWPNSVVVCGIENGTTTEVETNPDAN